MYSLLVSGPVILLAMSTSALPVTHPGGSIAGLATRDASSSIQGKQSIAARTAPTLRQEIEEEQQEIAVAAAIEKSEHDTAQAIAQNGKRAASIRRDADPQSQQEIEVIADILKSEHDTAQAIAQNGKRAAGIRRDLDVQQLIEFILQASYEGDTQKLEDYQRQLQFLQNEQKNFHPRSADPQLSPSAEEEQIIAEEVAQAKKDQDGEGPPENAVRF